MMTAGSLLCSEIAACLRALGAPVLEDAPSLVHIRREVQRLCETELVSAQLLREAAVQRKRDDIRKVIACTAAPDTEPDVSILSVIILILPVTFIPEQFTVKAQVPLFPT